MKKYRSMLILLGILAALLIAYFVTSLFARPGGLQPTPTASDASFTLYSVDDVTGVEINNTKTSDDLKFSRSSDGNTYTLISQPDLLVDSSRVADIVSKSAYVVGIKLIENNPKDLSIYGLDQPNIISVTLRDGSVKKLEIGSMTPTKDAYYFRSSANNNVYTLNQTIGQALFLAKDDVYDKTIFNFTVDDIQKLTYDKNGSNVFSFYYDPSVKMHVTSTPVKDFEVTIESFNGVAGQLIALKKDKYVAQSTDASKYGFDKPTAKFVVETQLQKKTLIFGTEVIKDQQVYGMIEGGKDIFLVDISSMNIKDVDVRNMITPYFWWRSIRNLTNVYVKLGDNVANCKLVMDPNSDSSKDQYYVNNIPIARDSSGVNYFQTFYGELIGMEAVQFEPNYKPAGNPDLVIEYTDNTNVKTKFEFFSKDKNYAYVVKNGVYTGALVDKSDFDKIAGVFNEMMKRSQG